MKNIVSLFLIITTLTITAQTTEREVVSANGNFYANSAGQLSTTLGEPVISTTTNGTNTLTQGFQQTQITVTGIEDLQTDFEMNIYPNPVSNFITIKIKELKENILLTIYTVEGKVVINRPLTVTETKLDVGSFAKGNYFLNVTQQNEIIKTYKIVKQ